jgi:hypothetical protein
MGPVGRQLGTLLIVTGVVLAGAGAVLLFSEKIPFLGRLPGDIVFRRGNSRLYIPVTSSVVISILATLLFWLVDFLRRK